MLSLVLVLFTALQADQFGVVQRWPSSVSGELWDVVLSQADADQSPRWSEHLEDTPLPPRRALLAAEAAAERLLPHFEKWAFQRISLERVTHVKDLWVYIVEYRTGSLTKDVPPDTQMRIVVLMNGKVIEPTRRPCFDGRC